jgi:hypothetical protein
VAGVGEVHLRDNRRRSVGARSTVEPDDFAVQGHLPESGAAGTTSATTTVEMLHMTGNCSLINGFGLASTAGSKILLNLRIAETARAHANSGDSGKPKRCLESGRSMRSVGAIRRPWTNR